jgi:hypothetical protein
MHFKKNGIQTKVKMAGQLERLRWASYL